MLTNIPSELRALRQWCAAGAKGNEGRPINPKTKTWAAVDDPSTWGTFEEAVATGYPLVGFVLAESDPYAVIDLDDKELSPADEGTKMVHEKILRMFGTYTERSKSGRGYHVILRGSAPNRKRKGVEVYSSAHFIICTGDVVKSAPIIDGQALLTQLVAEMPSSRTAELDEGGEEPMSDRELFDMAIEAENGEKFDRLTRGQWSPQEYSSQSEADLALLSILAFYTQNNEQVRRIFRLSPLGQREKAQKNDTYLNFALAKIRGNEPPKIDPSRIIRSAQDLPKKGQSPAREEEAPVSLDIPAPGFLGVIADMFYKMSIRPVKEIALTAAIGFSAGILGRSYNVSGTGLNQYLLLLAKTGTGKESMLACIDTTLNAIRQTVPSADAFVGPAAFASGQALIKTLSERPCFVSVLGEFGLTLQQLSETRNNQANIMLKKVLLDLFNKSGWSRTLRSSVYSDSERNTKIVQAPSITILGESTPETFLDTLESSHITEGLIPRFLIVHYNGPRPPKNPYPLTAVPEHILPRLVEIATQALTMANNYQCAQVAMSQGADHLFAKFDKQCDDMINRSAEVETNLWNRAHLKALRLAALCAVLDNLHEPTIDEQSALWAINLVRKDVVTMTSKFVTGDVGSGESKQIADIRRAIVQFYASEPEKLVKAYAVSQACAEKKVIPYVYLQRRSTTLASFRTDPRGATTALKRVVEELMSTGELMELNGVQKQNLGSIGRLFYGIKP